MLSRRDEVLCGVLAVILCGAFFLQGFFASRHKSPTNDEPVHIVSGAAYISTRTIVANPQHPPLMKELAGLSLALFGIRLHDAANRPAGWEWIVAQPFLIINGVGHALIRARLPLLLTSTLLGLTIYWWGRNLAGAWAGLAALFLFAFDPTMLGHSYLVTTDMGVAAMSLLFLVTLHRYTRKPGIGRLCAAGVALGLGLCAKFSGIFLLPIAAVLLAANVFWPEPSPDKALEGATRSRGTRARLVTAMTALLGMIAVALVIVQILYFSARGPQLYLHGLSRVNADHDPGTLHYLAGQLKPRFASYFVVAWLVKEPIATLALALAGTWIVLRQHSISRLSKLFLFLPPAVFVLACMVLADDLGLRYAIPAMPFAYLAGGIALATLWRGGALPRTLAIGACAWIGIAADGIYPDHLSYFNEAACLPGHANRIGWDGGSRCGPDWLADSNVDWGQSLPALKIWLDRHDPQQTIRLSYFGSFPPSAYGIHARDAKDFLWQRPAHGLFAISGSNLADLFAQGQIDWLRDEPAAVVGHAYYIYDLGPDPASPRGSGK